MAKKKKTKTKSPIDSEGYESLNISTQTQSPQQSVYVNPNYERGDNIASICAIKETITANTNDSGSLQWFINETPTPSGYARNYQSTTDGTRGATIILDAGAVFVIRQAFIDYQGVTAGTPTASISFSYSQDGAVYTTIGTDSFAINTDRIDNILGDYIFARFFKVVVTLNIGSSQDAHIILGKIRLII